MKRPLALLLALALCLGLGGAAMASADDGDLYEPQAWFGDWADAYELAYWDYADDVNSTGLILHFSSQPEAGLQLFTVYADRLRENGELREDSRLTYESDYGGYDQEVCYTYAGPKDVGSVTSLLGGTRCDLFLDSMWVDEDFLCLVVTWGDGFPMRVDMDELDYLPGDPGTTEPADAGILPDAWAFFNREVTHGDMEIDNGKRAVFRFEPDGVSAAYEYASLLQSKRFGLKLTDAWSDGSGGDMTHYYIFDYGGAGEDAEVESYAGGDLRYGDVILRIDDWPGQGWCEVSICFSDALTVADTGERSYVTGLRDTGSGGSTGPMGSAASDSAGGSPTPRPSSSGGSPASGSTSSAGHWEWRTVEKDCPACVGGRCPVCNGTGTYRLYGEAVPCDRYCSACDGRGTYTQQEYVYVPG